MDQPEDDQRSAISRGPGLLRSGPTSLLYSPKCVEGLYGKWFRRVLRYSSTHEKTLSDGSFRCRMEPHITLRVVSSTTARRIMRRIWRPLLGLVVVLLALAVLGTIYQAIATELAERAYPAPGEMIDVGGYSLHINCVGQGSPTVVLDAGLGGFFGPMGQGAAGCLLCHTRMLLRPCGDGLERDGSRTPRRQADH